MFERTCQAGDRVTVIGTGATGTVLQVEWDQDLRMWARVRTAGGIIGVPVSYLELRDDAELPLSRRFVA